MLSQTQKALDKCLLNYIWIKFKYSSQACAQLGNAGADPAAKTRRLFLNRNLGQLCISKKIRDIARCSQYKHQRLDGSQRTWEIIYSLNGIICQWRHFQNEKCRMNSFSDIIHSATVRKPSFAIEQKKTEIMTFEQCNQRQLTYQLWLGKMRQRSPKPWLSSSKRMCLWRVEPCKRGPRELKVPLIKIQNWSYGDYNIIGWRQLWPRVPWGCD